MVPSRVLGHAFAVSVFTGTRLEESIQRTVLASAGADGAAPTPPSGRADDPSKHREWFTQVATRSLADACSVCLSQIEKGETVSITKCMHFFHHKCLEPWIKKKHSCPVCRTILTGLESRSTNHANYP